ncbi:hypothetical protein [Parafrankia discariae]|uniref:hypothetical protein n=1 Tax=Parafrankia discariae TaxID=365528 RepID=UPI0003A18426|nr:hypothetical protein [Parafrankia discariae]
MEQAEGRRLATRTTSGSHVIVGLRAGDAGDLADVLLAAELAARMGSRLVVVAVRDRWTRWARWSAGMYGAFGMEGVAYASRSAEQEVDDEFQQRVADVVGLVNVEWTLEWVSGSCERAALRYARRNPTALVMFRPPSAR